MEYDASSYVAQGPSEACRSNLGFGKDPVSFDDVSAASPSSPAIETKSKVLVHASDDFRVAAGHVSASQETAELQIEVGFDKSSLQVSSSSESNMEGICSGPPLLEAILAHLDVGESVQENDAELAAIRLKWLPSTPRPIAEYTFEMDEIERLVADRHGQGLLTQEMPFDPASWLGLAMAYNSIGFSDMSTGAAHKSLLLVMHGLGLLQELGTAGAVRRSVGGRLAVAPDTWMVREELDRLHFEASCGVVSGLLDNRTLWEGLVEIKKSRKLWPYESELKYLEDQLKTASLFDIQEREKIGLFSAEVIRNSARIGMIYKLKYPWMEPSLFSRCFKLLEEVNDKINSHNVRICPALQNEHHTVTADVGPLGVFASKDIKKGENVLSDQSCTVVATHAAGKSWNCDCCSALLHPHLVRPYHQSLIRASCCKNVMFCSSECFDTGFNGYHKLLCGQDFDWLWEGGKGYELALQPRVLLRILAIVVCDISKAKSQGQALHPLQHPLLSRLTAGYFGAKARDNARQNWTYFSHIQAPNRILIQLGVDIFCRIIMDRRRYSHHHLAHSEQRLRVHHFHRRQTHR